MAKLSASEYKTKSGLKVIIRSADKSDADPVLKLSSAVIGEEIYQLTSSEEFKLTLEEEEQWIESHLNNPNHIVLLAEVESKIIGMIDFSNGHRKRISHTGEFGMSVSKDFRDQGIGSLLILSLVNWARSNSDIEKIGLNVHSNNARAIALYKKMGFEVEGVRKHDLKYGKDQYVDTVVMGLLLNQLART